MYYFRTQSVSKPNTFLFNSKTLISCSTLDKEVKSTIEAGNTCQASTRVGEVIAKRSLANKIAKVNFDRGGRIYHGRIKALADAARKEGLNF